MRALVTGATGFIGQRLIDRLDRPVVLSRDAGRARQALPGRQLSAAYDWDPMAGPPPAKAFDGVDAVFHLAGEPIAEGRWTAAKKERLRESRVAGTRNLVAALRSLDNRPPVLVSASAIGYYGSRGDEILDESASAGDDFLAEICAAWERESAPARELGIRVINPRIGLVLGKGGALDKMLPPFKVGLGGRLGSGRQWMSWIHVDDLVNLLLFAVEQPLQGPLNAVAPVPATNRDFTKALASALHRPAFLPAPYFGLRLLFGEFASVLYASQRVVPRVAEAAGFRYQFPEVNQALTAILQEQQPLSK